MYFLNIFNPKPKLCIDRHTFDLDLGSKPISLNEKRKIQAEAELGKAQPKLCLAELKLELTKSKKIVWI